MTGEGGAPSNPRSVFLDRLLGRLEEGPGAARGPGWGLELLASEDFRVVGELGRGGMGIVYLAEQRSLRRLVALKFLPPHLALSASSRERLRREALAIAWLRHESILPLHAIGEKDGAPFLAMEFVAGVPLSLVLEELAGREPSELCGPDFLGALDAAWGEQFGPFLKDGTLRLGEEGTESGFWIRPYPAICAALIRRIAEALECAHRSGILHRDVKPSNILVTRTGKAYLVDFGLARDGTAVSLTESREFLGTIQYASPEALLAREGQRRPSGDVYSLGIVLYEMLTLRNPFEGESREATIHRIVTLDPKPVRRWNPAVSAGLETVCMTAVAKEPRWRYEGAGLFAADLGRSLNGEPVAARRVGPITRRIRLIRRDPLPALGAVCAVGILGWALTFLQGTAPAIQQGQAPQEAAPKTSAGPEAKKVAPPVVVGKPEPPPLGEGERLLADGAGFFVGRQFAPAQKALTRLLATDWGNLAAHALQAANLAQIRNYGEALKALLPALGLRPDSAALLEMQAWILDRLGRRAGADRVSGLPRGDYVDAAEEAARAALLVLKGDLAAAEQSFARVSFLDPAAAWPLLPRGIILAFLNPQKALSALEDFERRAPRDPLALTGLGFLWHRLGDLGKAEGCFRLALQIDPGFDFATLGMSRVREGSPR